MSSLIPLALLIQITPVQPLPKGTGKPPSPQDEASAVMAPVNAVFAAIAARNGELLRSILRDDGNLTIASEAADGTRAIIHRTTAQFVANLKAGPERFEEQLYDPAIEVDGDVALVWGRYNFYIDGKLHHCGYDLFDMVREGGAWKIANISYSSRTKGCEG